MICLATWSEYLAERDRPGAVDRALERVAKAAELDPDSTAPGVWRLRLAGIREP